MNMQVRFLVMLFMVNSLLSAISASNNSIVLSMQDMNNRSISQAMVTAPFILQLELNDDDFIDSDIKYISGMDSFKHSPAMRHSHASTRNGKNIHKIIYRFVLQSDKKGTFTVGPFSLKDKTGKFIKSNRLIIVVADKVMLSDQVDAPKYMIESRLEQQNVHVGEKATAKVQFFDRIFVDNPTVVLPEFENLHVLSVEQDDVTTLQRIDGYDYAVTQWSINFYPLHAGSLVIDGIKVKFLDQRLEETSLAKGVFRRFGSMMKVQRELQTHPVNLTVVELPKKIGFKDVTAVGQFLKLVISINKKSIEQGQGLVVTLELFGDGNFEMMNSIPLILPHGFQSYDAGTIQINKDRTCKHSEFIVQAQEPGKYRIAPQKISYFDPHDDTYKTLYSNAIDIVVTAHQNIEKINDQEIEHNVIVQKVENVTSEKNVADYTILEPIVFCIKPELMISLWWYEILMYFLFFIFFMMIIYRYCVEKYIFTDDRWQHFMMFLQAKKSCKYAAYKNNAVVLYSLFINLFIALKVSSAGIINEDVIEQYLKLKNFSPEQIVQWRQFYSKLLRASFAHDDQLDTTVLFQESLVWLQQLKEKI